MASRPKKRKTAHSGTRQALAWCRGVGVGAVLVGAMGLTTVIPFWWAIGLVYVGFMILIADVLLLESELPKKWKFALVVALLVLGVLFSNGVVFSSAPLDISAMATDADYPVGTPLPGIQWRSPFSELKLVITNPSGSSYENVSIFVKPNKPIASIGQTSDLAGVSFMCGHDPSVYVDDIDPSGHKTAIPLVLVATDAGYYVRLDKLPSGRPLELVLAIAGMKEPKRLGKFDNDYMVRTSFQNAREKEPVFCWWGHRSHSDDIYTPREVTTMVTVRVTYTAKLKPRTISQDIAPIVF